MIENKLDIIKMIVKDNFGFTWGKMYYSPEIPEKILTKLQMKFCIIK